MAFLSVRRAIAILLMLAPLAVLPARAQENLQLFEQEIEAGLLYNFIKYTQWPADHAARPNVVVCLLGGDPFSGHLQPLAGRTVNQRNIEIRDLGAGEDWRSCALLFVNAGVRQDWPRLQRALNGRDILTVSNTPDFASSGGMIEFSRVENRVNVKINIDAVAAARLTVESRLLRLASTVRPAAE